MKKTMLFALIVMLASTASALSPDEINEILLGTELQIPKDRRIDPKASQSDLGKLSKTVLGHLYTYVESINYVDDTRANVKAHIGHMACDMNFVHKEYEAPLTMGNSKLGWKLENIDCR